jgi:hypothetical protein
MVKAIFLQFSALLFCGTSNYHPKMSVLLLLMLLLRPENGSIYIYSYVFCWTSGKKGVYQADLNRIK